MSVFRLCVLSTLLGCGGPAETPDSGHVDSGNTQNTDAGSRDSGVADSGPALDGGVDAGISVDPDSGPLCTLTQAQYLLPGDDLFPEGGAFDPIGCAFYVGSLQHGSVTRIDALDGTSSTLLPGTEANWRTLGMNVDAEHRRLWVCAIEDVDPQRGEAWAFDLTTGTRTRYDLREAAANASCNDVALDSRGRAYFTDREHPNIYRVHPESADVELWANDPLLAPPTLGLGQNGIVVLPDESAVITTTYLTPRLHWISIADPNEVVRVDIDGDFSDFTSPGSGADGMVFLEGSLYVMFVSELIRVSPIAGGWGRARADSVGVESQMSDVIVANSELFLLNGQAVRYIGGTSPELPFALRRFEGSFP